LQRLRAALICRNYEFLDDSLENLCVLEVRVIRSTRRRSNAPRDQIKTSSIEATMPAVFVHGVPDTHRVWNPLLASLTRKDVVALSLPGFGCARPEGFSPIKEQYVEWLIAQLEAIPQPIDLVAHDWGALLAIRTLSLRPELARTWAVGAAPVDSTYRWHSVAALWQTPEVGERIMEALTPEALRQSLITAAVPEPNATETAAHVDATMKACILSLYRSAINVGQEWEPDLTNVPAKGLVLWGENDPYAATEFGTRLAQRTRAAFRFFPQCGHWWQLERPGEVASHLQSLWM
jgi:pimeloyl-ACP methyl ester carboxylesterase